MSIWLSKVLRRLVKLRIDECRVIHSEHGAAEVVIMVGTAVLECG